MEIKDFGYVDEYPLFRHIHDWTKWVINQNPQQIDLSGIPPRPKEVVNYPVAHSSDNQIVSRKQKEPNTRKRNKVDGSVKEIRKYNDAYYNAMRGR